MKNWRKSLLKSNETIRKAMEALTASSTQIVLVVDEKGALLGTVSDGDIRSAILRGAQLDHPVDSVMNKNPSYVFLGTPREEILALMKARSIRQVPVLTPQRVVVGLELVDSYLDTPKMDNTVVLMAGGLGSRLRPLTDECPKPLLQVNGKPILEWIVEGFLQYGFHNFVISVNYKAKMIEDHFGDGSRWGAKINYIHETSRLGTAGALRLLTPKPTEPFFVMNGDLLTKINFGHLMKFHKTSNNSATMCVQNYEVRIPFGVVETSGRDIKKIVEKPTYTFLVNSGIYVFDPSALEMMPGDEYVDVPCLFDSLINTKKRTRVFPTTGFWMDVGHKEDLERAHEVFKGFENFDLEDFE